MNPRNVVFIALLALTVARAVEPLAPGPVPPEVRAQFQLAPFYQKYIGVGGLPIVGSVKVSDTALVECAWIVSHMLERRPDILAALGAGGVRFAIMAHDEYTTDIPEHADKKPRIYWDRRARGLGATPEEPVVSAAEENLLGFPGDPYPREIIAIHEFGHAIHEVGMKAIDPTFDTRLHAAYDKAIAAGLWKDTYAAVNHIEYWAEAVQDWFDNNAAHDALHNGENSREKLQAYDPGVAALCAEVFGDIPWRYRKPTEREPSDREHLGGFDPAKAPRFEWRREPVGERPRVSFQSAAGELEITLDTRTAGEQIEKFLRQVQSGYYSSGSAIFRTEGIELTAAAQLPTGDPVPSGEGGWHIRFGAPATDSLTAKITKGGVLIPLLIRESSTEGVRVQRIVRLN